MSPFTIVALTAALLLIFSGLYLLLKTHNMLRIIIAIEIVMKAITLLLVFAGLMNGKMALTQAFIITVILVEVVVAVVAAGVAINLYRHNGDMEISRLNKLNG
ncbi:MAG: NADH-quinone oxidoreductase subunit K [Firmicutes bacterium]|nr:NADH-quinone oxidoreductase subunit K [Bacillota bacterium]